MTAVLTALGIGMVALVIYYVRTGPVVRRKVEELEAEAERDLQSLKVKH